MPNHLVFVVKSYRYDKIHILHALLHSCNNYTPKSISGENLKVRDKIVPQNIHQKSGNISILLTLTKYVKRIVSKQSSIEQIHTSSFTAMNCSSVKWPFQPWNHKEYVTSQPATRTNFNILQIAYRVNMFPYTFNKATTTNPLSINFYQSCKVHMCQTQNQLISILSY